MPTSATNTYALAATLEPAFPSPSILPLNVKLKASTTFPAGCVIGEITASPGTYGPYASGNSDGTQIPRGLLKYACTTDASGNFAFGDYDVQLSATAYFNGSFRTDDLPQSGTGAIDAGAVTAGTWRLLEGTVASGIVSLG